MPCRAVPPVHQKLALQESILYVLLCVESVIVSESLCHSMQLCALILCLGGLCLLSLVGRRQVGVPAGELESKWWCKQSMCWVASAILDFLKRCDGWGLCAGVAGGMRLGTVCISSWD